MGDEITILDSEGNIVHVMNYEGTAESTQEGKAIGLNPSAWNNADSTDTDWCVQTSTYGNGDSGTPGKRNDVCN